VCVYNIFCNTHFIFSAINKPNYKINRDTATVEAFSGYGVKKIKLQEKNLKSNINQTKI